MKWIAKALNLNFTRSSISRQESKILCWASILSQSNYTKENYLPSNNPSMDQGSFGSVHGTGNLSVE